MNFKVITVSRHITNMKNLKYFFFLALSVAILSCSEDADEQPLNEKRARIEVEFEGSLDQYMINFGIHSLNKGLNGFVTPIIQQPTDVEWTQVVEQANTYNLSMPLIFPKLIVGSKEPVHTIGFIFNAIHTGGIPDENFQELKATIKVFGDDEEVKSYEYTARPVGEVSMPLSETIRF